MKKNIMKVQNLLLPNYTGSVFAYGNSKLPKNTLIVNLSSAQNCPSTALGICKVADVCYALKAERIYSNYKNKNLTVEPWIQSAPTADIKQMMTAYIDNASEKIEYIRLNEAGDFKDQEQVQQWSEIAEYYEQNNGIHTYTYTARADLDFSEATFTVNGSLPNIKGAAREYRCIPQQDFDALPTKLPQGEYKCPGDCKKCHVCFNDKFKGLIYCRKH